MANTTLELTLDDRRVAPQGGYVSKQCARRAHNNNDPSYDGLSVPDSEADLQRMQDGVAFESEIGERMRTLLSMVDIDASTDLTELTAVAIPARVADKNGKETVESRTLREDLTMAAMKAGVTFIWNARLQTLVTESKVGEPDALVRIGKKPTATNGWAYAPLDVKHHKSLEGSSREKAVRVSDLGDPLFESSTNRLIGDGKPQKQDSMQLAHYHEMLSALGHGQVGEMIWGGIIGKEAVVVWRDLAEKTHKHFYQETTQSLRDQSILDIYNGEFNFILKVISRAQALASDPTLEPLAMPEWKGECKSCPWRDVCKSDLKESNHITLVQGVTPDRAVSHYANGVTKVSELARLNWKTALLVQSGLDVPEFMALANSWSTQDDEPSALLATIKMPAKDKRDAAEALAVAGIKTVADVAKLDTLTARYSRTGGTGLADAIDHARARTKEHVFLRRGVSKLEIPRADIELDIDMENDPGGIIYLWGTRLTVRTKKISIDGDSYRPFCTFVKDDVAGELEAFKNLWNMIQTLEGLAKLQGLSFKAYCYTNAEERCMKHIVKSNPGSPGIPTLKDLESFFASENWVDLYDVLIDQTVWPTDSMSLKETAKWARMSWTAKGANGDQSTVWYQHAVKGDEDAKATLLQYNADDVKATFWLRDFLSQLSGRSAGKGIDNISTLDRFFDRRTRKK